MSAEFRQVLLLTFFSWALVFPQLSRNGLNVVTHTYDQAAHRFWSGQNPYAPSAHGDQFKYPPFFAALYGPFAALPGPVQALAWAWLGIFVFWFGVSKFFMFNRGSPWVLWLALGLCSMGLDISVRYQQVNALLTGLLLWGLHAARDGRMGKSAALFFLNADFKILPGLFAFTMGVPPRARYWGAAAISLAACFILPSLQLGWTGNRQAHETWFGLLAGDLGARGILDIGTVLSRWGLGFFGNALRFVILFVTAGVLLGMRLRGRTDWGYFYVLGACALLLFSPRTESPTFVLVAPAYLFLARAAWKLRAEQRGAALTGLAAVAFAITFCYSDAWPKSVWDPRGYSPKTLGTLAIWVWTCAWSLKRSSRV